MSNAQDEDEEDYMSQAFLDSLVNEGKRSSQSEKGSLTYSERRRQKEREHLANLPKPLHVREKEAREKGLEKEIGEENKGMAMLLKMGFKKGGTLGAPKTDTDAGSSSRITGTTLTPSQGPDISTISRPEALRAPIAIQMKQGRGGLGMESAKRRREDEELQKQQNEAHRMFDEGFRVQKISQFEQEKWKRQLAAARGLCMRMDAQKAAASIPLVDEEQTQRENEDEDTESQQPRRIGRSNSFWWISDSVPDEILGTRLMGPGAEVTHEPSLGGRAFDHSDEEDGDLESNKEKPKKRTKLDPVLLTEEEDAEPEVYKWGERSEFAQLEESKKLERVVQYLRAEHSYCFWCSAQFDSQEDLEENCPGETEDDH
ncbi:G patch domain-containing protein 11 [Mortierella alpina]|nr:G patch domain-containing protein 11 [Mortierella alpina]